MSWASRRVTTRDEDIAYCLLGIFNVNMPLLYGEGEKAFIVSHALASSKTFTTTRDNNESFAQTWSLPLVRL